MTARGNLARRLFAGVGLVALLVVVAVVVESRDRGDLGPVATDPPATRSPRPPTSAAVVAGSAPAVSTTTLPTEPIATTTAVAVEPLPESGSGVFVAALGPAATFGPAPHLEFSVAVEEGIGVDADEVAAFVDATLGDQRSWIGDGVTGLRRVEEGGRFTLVVATPATVDRLCAPLRTNGYFSCGSNGWIALNLHRWQQAVDDWPSDLETYRRYLVNHEVGHYLRGPAHDTCPGAGMPAPVMMQQTKGLDGCTPNGWVHP